MFDEQIEILIDAIETYNKKDKYIILMYVPYSDDDEIYDFDFYFAVLSSPTKPTKPELDALFEITRLEVGNMIYAADTLVLTRNKALLHLESLI